MDICDAFEKQITLKNEGKPKPYQMKDGRVPSRSNGVGSELVRSENLAEQSMPPSMPSILASNRVGTERGENESRIEDDSNDYTYGNEQAEQREYRSERLASEDYKSQDEDLDNIDKDLDEKSSPRRESSLVKWWKSRDSLLSPKAL